MREIEVNTCFIDVFVKLDFQNTPYDTQVLAVNSIVLANYTIKNVGIHLLPICFLRPTTALSADEQSDTHECIAGISV